VHGKVEIDSFFQERMPVRGKGRSNYIQGETEEFFSGYQKRLNNGIQIIGNGRRGVHW
jgi:hypothetical protein